MLLKYSLSEKIFYLFHNEIYSITNLVKFGPNYHLYDMFHYTHSLYNTYRPRGGVKNTFRYLDTVVSTKKLDFKDDNMELI